MEPSVYVGPATSVSHDTLRDGASAQSIETAALLVRTEPGCAAVIVTGQDGQPSTVVGQSRLLSRVPHQSGELFDDWLRQLVLTMESAGYLVLDEQGEIFAPGPARPGWPPVLRPMIRRSRAWLARPMRRRASMSRAAWRRRRFIMKLRYEAWLVGAQLELDVAEDLLVEPGVRVQIRPGRSKVVIGPRCQIASGVILRLGGELVMGRNVELRYDVALNVKGRLDLRGRNGLARGTMVHADGDMVWEWGACSSEYVTVLDSHHEYDGSLVHVHDQGIEVRPITIGAGSLLGAKATVMPGVRVGRACLVGAGSLVTKDIPDGWIAVGSPAKALRPVIATDGIESS